MAKNEKNNAKSPRPVPSKLPVNGGTEGSVPTPSNLGVPTPPNPFDPAAAMGQINPAGIPRAPFAPPDDSLKMVQGLIFHWPKEELKNLITFAAHLLTQEESTGGAEGSPAEEAAEAPEDENAEIASPNPAP